MVHPGGVLTPAELRELMTVMVEFDLASASVGDVHVVFRDGAAPTTAPRATKDAQPPTQRELEMMRVRQELETQYAASGSIVTDEDVLDAMGKPAEEFS